MNIVVGYIQCDGDLARRAVRVRALAALGCQTVRVEASAAPDRAFKPVLESVCGFLGEGDELVAPDITHLGSSPRAADAFLSRLGARGARACGYWNCRPPERTAPRAAACRLDPVRRRLCFRPPGASSTQGR